MRLAIIDLGTNSVRFDVHQIGPGKSSKLLHREKIMVRLGQGLFTSGQLDPNAIHRTVHAFKSFKATSQQLNVRRIVAFGTSALRDASDSKRLISSVRSTTGIEIRVIPGSEEARLIALGILSKERIGRGAVGLVDIGGGSTEISVCRGPKVYHSVSLPLGTARLQQSFLKSSPPGKKDLNVLRSYIREVIANSKGPSKKKLPKATRVIGSSGTIRAVARILKKYKRKKAIELKDLSALIDEMSVMDTSQLLGVPGMESKRVDIILAGAVVLEECMKALKVRIAVPTDYALRDGIFYDQLQLHSGNVKTEIALQVSDLYEKAKRFGLYKDRLERGVKIAETLFERLRPIHKLDRSWRLYLTAAMILRNCGEVVSPIDSNEHSYYIVKNSYFPFAEEWGSEFVARLCRYRQRNKLEQKQAPFPKGSAPQKAFLKVLGILRVADALDVDPEALISLRRVRVSGREVEITFASNRPADVESFHVSRQSEFFERVYRRALKVKRL